MVFCTVIIADVSGIKWSNFNWPRTSDMKSSKLLYNSTSMGEWSDLIVEPDIGSEELSLGLDKGVLIVFSKFKIGVIAVAADISFIYPVEVSGIAAGIAKLLD